MLLRRISLPADGSAGPLGEPSMIGCERSNETVTDNHIRGAEALLGIEFPDLYRSVIRRFSGSFGDAEFRVDRPLDGLDVCGVGLILSLLPHSRNSIYTVMSAWEEHGLSPRLVPIGEDGGGNYLCLDYRESDVPSVAFYFHELWGDDGIMKVCNSFDELLERITAPAEGDG